MKYSIPYLLIVSRLLIGLVILWISMVPVSSYALVTTILLAIGLLTDILDGIIARRLNISTQRLRRMDSTVDQIFFLCVIGACYMHCPAFFKTNWVLLVLLGTAEGITYIVSFWKFRKEIATHSIGAKLWTLLLFSTLIQLLWTCDSGLLFQACFWVGILTRLEIIGIILVLKQWAHDVPTLYHAIQLRRGKPIRRNKLFNG